LGFGHLALYNFQIIQFVHEESRLFNITNDLMMRKDGHKCQKKETRVEREKGKIYMYEGKEKEKRQTGQLVVKIR
jgi:hypothetical protein